MCGIVGYLGKRNSKEILLNGLQELEYRGYDSAGVAILESKNNEISNLSIYKAVGKLENLRSKMDKCDINNFNIGIGHTRWATHGTPSEANAHPHSAQNSYVVHNGIIENYQELKRELEAKKVVFYSQTDTEIIVKLFEFYLKKLTPFKAFQQTLKRLEGSYAILLITQEKPDSIFFAKYGSPLIIGSQNEEHFFSSSDSPLIGYVKEVTHLEDHSYGYVENSSIFLFDQAGSIKPSMSALASSKLSAQKNGFRYFMEKEIYEQSDIIGDTLLGRIKNEKIYFEELEDGNLLNGINEIKFCACGTSYHSALMASYLFERIGKIRTSVEIGSEFRYKEPLLNEDTLFIVVSQSGETADTLESLKMAKKAGLKTLTICNVDNSSMVRLSDYSLLTRAGIEKGVASTKAFATQATLLWMLSLYIAQIKKSKESAFIANEVSKLRHLSSAMKVTDSLHEKIRRLSKRYLHGHGFFYIGRDIFYPLALEGALKLKEISYMHAEGYPSGEMKHGPIALADPELFTIALMPKNILYDKTKSNIEELSARDSTICAISPYQFELADDFIQTKERDHPMLEFFEMMVITQLLAMEISIRLKNDVDMPRNLAKSVTVE